MGSDLNIGVLGATGAVGREAVTVLDRVSWRPAQLSPAASAMTTVSTLAYGEETLPVEDVRDLDTGLLDAVINRTTSNTRTNNNTNSLIFLLKENSIIIVKKTYTL